MRVFVAIVLSDESQRRLRVPLQRLVEGHASILRAIPDRTAHVTMAFVGAVEERAVAGIGEAMREVAQAGGPAVIELSGPRILYARRDPRLIMLPVTTGAPRIEAIANDLYRAITARLPSLEVSSAKSAHVTLARFRKHARASDARAVEQSLGQAGIASLVLRDEVRDIRLFESTLTASGPEYRELSRAEFFPEKGASQ